MRERVYLSVFRGPVDAAETREGVLAVYVHGARTADALPAGSTERERRVDLILYFDEGVENLKTRKYELRMGDREVTQTMGPVWLRSMV